MNNNILVILIILLISNLAVSCINLYNQNKKNKKEGYNRLDPYNPHYNPPPCDPRSDRYKDRYSLCINDKSFSGGRNETPEEFCSKWAC